MTVPVVIAGTGAIGAFTGGLLAAAGQDVIFWGRSRVIDEIAAHGLRLTDHAGLDRHVPKDALTTALTPECLAGAGLVLVCVKTAGTREIARDILAHAPGDAPVVSLQNGLDACRLLEEKLPGRDVRPGVVAFNVVPRGEGRFHRSTSGDILIGPGPARLAERLSVPGLGVTERIDIEAVQWGKLLLNLNNAPNALSGLPLALQLQDRAWRRIMADQMAEALKVLKARGVAATSTTPVPPWLIPHILRLPTPVFRRVAASMLTIDPEARTSMAHDLNLGRPTEVGAFQGRIIAMAGESGTSIPLTRRIVSLIADAEAMGGGCPMLLPDEVRG